ncbi:MAG: hypothetical protein P4L85_13520, partial [Paludisphaera borealis]|uniref:hypothetical protein n=1 Tax=Paludisphaera borealis TaxID=1387353 RepID=UPI0028506D1B
VEIAGVIVNSLSEGVQNWSSYGYPSTPVGLAPRRDRALPAASTTNQPDDEALLVAASAGR